VKINFKKTDTAIQTPASSHNLTEDERILALVRFIARRAAENDYQELLDVLKSNPDYDILDATKEE